MSLRGGQRGMGLEELRGLWALDGPRGGRGLREGDQAEGGGWVLPGDSLSKFRLDGTGHAGVADGEEAAGRRAGGEPVAARQPLHERHEVGLKVGGRVLVRDGPQGLHRLVPHHGFLHRGQRLQGWLGGRTRGHRPAPSPCPTLLSSSNRPSLTPPKPACLP